MINKIPVADRDALEQGLKRLKLRHTREIVDSAHELAIEEEPGYIDFLAYLVEHEIKKREETQRLNNMKRAKFPQKNDVLLGMHEIQAFQIPHTLLVNGVLERVIKLI
jgi:DNA replication protein DnaC